MKTAYKNWKRKTMWLHWGKLEAVEKCKQKPASSISFNNYVSNIATYKDPTCFMFSICGPSFNEVLVIEEQSGIQTKGINYENPRVRLFYKIFLYKTRKIRLHSNQTFPNTYCTKHKTQNMHFPT